MEKPVETMRLTVDMWEACRYIEHVEGLEYESVFDKIMNSEDMYTDDGYVDLSYLKKDISWKYDYDNPFFLLDKYYPLHEFLFCVE